MDESEFEHLRLEPAKNSTIAVPIVQVKGEKPVNMTGFYFPKKTDDENKQQQTSLDENGNPVEEDIKKLNIQSDQSDEKETKNNNNNNESGEKREDEANKSETRENTESNDKEEDDQNDNENDENEQDEDEDDDGEGWIKPSNLAEVKKKSQVDAEQKHIDSARFKVACMTSDFAMQASLNYAFKKQCRCFKINTIFKLKENLIFNNLLL